VQLQYLNRQHADLGRIRLLVITTVKRTQIYIEIFRLQFNIYSSVRGPFSFVMEGIPTIYHTSHASLERRLLAQFLKHYLILAFVSYRSSEFCITACSATYTELIILYVCMENITKKYFCLYDEHF